jgi:hypothetical protein
LTVWDPSAGEGPQTVLSASAAVVVAPSRTVHGCRPLRFGEANFCLHKIKKNIKKNNFLICIKILLKELFRYFYFEKDQ